MLSKSVTVLFILWLGIKRVFLSWIQQQRDKNILHKVKSKKEKAQISVLGDM